MNRHTHRHARGVAAACIAALAAPSALAQTCTQLDYTNVNHAILGYSWEAVAGDWNGDGATDLALGYRDKKVVSLLANGGGGAFRTSTTLVTGVISETLDAGDLDGDSDLDLVVAGAGPTAALDGVSVLRNLGAGQFALQPLLGLGGLGSQPVGVRLGDLDGDQDLDLVVLLAYPGGVVTYLNDGMGGFTPTGTLFATGYAGVNLALGDFDADGHLDCAALTGTVGMQLTIGWGRGDGSFEAPTSYGANVYGHGLVTGDFDGDGDLDLVSGHKYGLIRFDYQSNRSFAPGATGVAGFYNKGLAATDLDGDGKLDLVATFGSSASIRFLRNSGGGSFTTLASHPAGVQGFALTVGDWNGDGQSDALSADYDFAVAKVWTASCSVGTYCTAKLNSAGCTPAISASGTFGSATQPFTVSATNVINGKFGLMFYGLGSANLPLLGGTLCVLAPIRRTPASSSGGNPPPDDCSGSYAFDFDAWLASGADPSLIPGSQVFAQFWSRDPLSSFGSGLTDALQFTILP